MAIPKVKPDPKKNKDLGEVMNGPAFPRKETKKEEPKK